ncbi:pyridoxamine 5'-phosphate oxidase family protein [Chryseolinea lacunae]|uniref:Pyridoxamine 5'-phosphate oxidase family protein n=1 Tax=Chryseolinea lacunae TaxID=2801331 RepID=A0ABS1KV44_9BACT|nr:pyridoxamine 5'-phosphate oxidase family protein [Chryseolinea lacunae]MBL0743210.1 pyridoxamine 5'-phosphate oxidase family protein [Chryseolinea lacunae]
MSQFPITDKTEITRLPKRGVYDKDVVYSILDEGLFCTLAYARDGQAFQIPTGFCRIGDKLYLHGSVGSFYMRELAEKKPPVSIGVTFIDGLVLARSAFHHSVNYRSVVIFSTPEKVDDADELYKALEVFTNKMQPGRWDDVRKPNSGEWKATMLLSFKIDEASAKVRTGGPKDDEEDYALDIWAGVVPLEIQRKPPIADDVLKAGVALPDYLK